MLPLVEQLDVLLCSLVNEGANAFNYMNPRTSCSLPVSGHDNQRRPELRQVNLWNRLGPILTERCSA